jgi:hypothetical protein
MSTVTGWGADGSERGSLAGDRAPSEAADPAFAFTAPLIEWRGPAPYFFVRVPEEVAEDLAELGPDVTYGWGMIPVQIRIAGHVWETSLWPKEGGYLVPVRAAVRRGLELEVGDDADVSMVVATRDGRLVDPSSTTPRLDATE